MKTKSMYLFVVTATIVCLNQILSADEFGGIEFPQGVSSFADEIVSYEPGYSGGAVPTHPDHIKPSDALGRPDHSGVNFAPGSVSLGSGGRIVLKFTNNLLTGSGDSAPDLHIFEIGSDVEDTFVDISKDGATWFAIGKVFGATSSIDIDAFGFTSSDSFPYVRLTDDPNEGGKTGATVGADIDAVGAISTISKVHLPDLLIETAVMVSFPSLPGSAYTIEESTDLENWSESIVDIAGDGTVKKFFFEITSPRTFYQLKSLE